MAESILGLLFEISADPKKAQAALAELKASTVAESTEISKAWSAAMDIISGPAGIALGAVVGLGGGMLEAANQAAEFGESLLLASKRTGIAVESLSGLRMAAKMTDVEFATVEKGLEIAARNLSDFAGPASKAGQALDSLGISAKDTHGHMKAMDELLAEVADKFQSMPDGPEKTAAAMAIFGRSGAELIPILDEGSKGLKKFEDQAKSTGEYMTTEGAEAAEKYRQQMKLLSSEFHGLWLEIGQVSESLMGRLAGALNAAIGAHAGESFWESLSQGAKNVAGAFLYMLAPLDDTASALLRVDNPLRKLAYDLIGNQKEIQTLTDQLIAVQGPMEKHVKVLTNTADAAKKTGKAEDFAAGGVHHLTEWMKRASVVLPQVNTALLNLKVTAQDLGQTLRTSFEVGLLGGAADPFGVLANSLHKTIDIIPIANARLAEMANLLPGPHVRALTEEFATLRTGIKSWAVAAKVDVGSASADFQHLNTIGGQAFDSLNKGMNSAIVNALIYKESWGKAMAEVTKTTLASVASEAVVRALQATALGFYDLALTPPNVPGATAAFESAALWGSIAAGSGLGARAIGGGGGSGSDANGPVATWDAAAGGAASGGRGIAPNLKVYIVGDREAAQEVIRLYNVGVDNGGSPRQNPHPQYVTPGRSL